MNEQDTPVEAPEGPPDGSPAPEGGEPRSQAQKLSAEAAKFRTQLRAAEAALVASEEAAREGAARAEATIEKLQRDAILNLAKVVLAKPADLFTLAETTVADYLTEEGLVDVEKVRADIAALLADRPLLKATQPAVDPSQGTGGRPEAKPELSWSNALNG